jgi:hypothetical protein
MAQMRKSAARPGKPAISTKVKVSPNVTVVAPKGKRISSAEEARLKNINKLAKSSKGDAKVNAKALKQSGKAKPKTDTKMKQFKPNSFELETKTAREFAREAAARRAEAAARRGRLGGGGLGGGFGMGSGGGSGRSNVNR